MSAYPLTFSSFDTEIFLRSFIHKEDHIGVLSQYVDYKTHPEVLVVIAEEQLRSEQLTTFAPSLLKFREILNNAPSSLQVPFVDMSHAFDIHLINVVSHVGNNDGQVFYLGKGSPLLKDILSREQKTITADFASFPNLLNKHDIIFSNGKTDLIIVYLSNFGETNFEQTDKVIADVHRQISAVTDKYVCVYTGLAYDNPDYNVDFGTKRHHPLPSLKRHILQSGNDSVTNGTANGTVPVFRQYFGGWFWELFVVMLVLVPLLIIGTYSIDSIQTPIFEAKKKN